MKVPPITLPQKQIPSSKFFIALYSSFLAVSCSGVDCGKTTPVKKYPKEKQQKILLEHANRKPFQRGQENEFKVPEWVVEKNKKKHTPLSPPPNTSLNKQIPSKQTPYSTVVFCPLG